MRLILDDQNQSVNGGNRRKVAVDACGAKGAATGPDDYSSVQAGQVLPLRHPNDSLLA